MAIKLTLRILLGQRNMMQKELAERTGIRQPTISAICTNTARHLPIDVIDKICSVLNCEPGDWIKKETTD